MKTKALILSALILVPTAGAGAATVQTAPVPAQDFRVSYTEVAPLAAPNIFSN